MIDLKLNVTDNGTDRWQVCLQKVAEANVVRGWSGTAPGYSRELANYDTGGSGLSVFISCEGPGSSADCEVVINGISKGKITANYDDDEPAGKTFPV